jgi:hypothetical protein
MMRRPVSDQMEKMDEKVIPDLRYCVRIYIRGMKKTSVRKTGFLTKV